MKVSILGSCLLRDIFNSKFVANYAEHFTVDSYFARTTIPSLMGKAYNYSIKALEKKFNALKFEYLYTECSKCMLTILENNNSDYLLMDFYADAYYGTCEYDGEYYSNWSFKKLLKLDIADGKKPHKVYNFEHNTDEYFEIWKKAFDKFMEYVREHMPETKIIINGIKGSNQITKDGKLIGIQQPKRSIEKLNNLWSRFDNYCKEKYGLTVIEYEKKYTLDTDYLFGLNSEFVHFHPEYYNDAFKKLVELCVKPAGKINFHRNLIRNSSFDRGFRCWSLYNGRWGVENSGSKNVIRPLEASEHIWKSIWTDPIEINGDGETEYTLSFNVRIKNARKVKSPLIVFGVRTFKKAVFKTYKESISTELISIEPEKIEIDKDIRISYTFKPNGKFIRVAPHVRGEVCDIEFSQIQLEKGDEMTQYKKCLDDDNM